MKLPELKNRFMGKYMIKIVAGVLTVALLGSSLTAVAVQADQNEKAEVKTKTVEETDTEDTLSDLLSVEVNDEKIGKEENVYILADANGNVHDTIVTNHLINNTDADTIRDYSELTDIENTKGNETYTANGKELTWQADGKDIYYRGNSTQETPVTQKVTYYLDGEEIAPQELAGKSGKVTIRFDYVNNSTYTEKINGEEVNVKVPYAAVTAMVLDDRFTHVEVTNGKLESNGDNAVAIGYALPGIKESLHVEDSDFVEELDLPEYFEITADVENFELDTAMTIVVNAGTMVSMKEGDTSSLDTMINDLVDATGKLKDGSADLADGLDTLQSSLADYASGMSELYSKSGDLAGGVNTLNASAASLNKGIQSLDKALNAPMGKEEQEAAKNAAAASVAKEFEEGKTQEVAAQIYSALRYAKTEDGSVTDGALYTSLYDGAYSANAAEAVYNEVVRQVLLSAAGQPADSAITADQAAAGIQASFAKGAQAGDQTSAAMYAVSSGMTSAQLAELLYAKSGAKDTLFAKTQSTIKAQLAAGRSNEQIQAAVEQSMNTLATQLAGACQEVASQAAQAAVISGAESAKQTIASQIEAIQESGYSLVTGAGALSKGTQTLADQIPALTDGITALNDATTQIVDGVDQLTDGSHELADGMVEFDEEGISKIVNSYNGDIKPLTDRLQAMLDAGKEYQNFSGVAEGVNSSVKFIYKLDSVKCVEEE